MGRKMDDDYLGSDLSFILYHHIHTVSLRMTREIIRD